MEKKVQIVLTVTASERAEMKDAAFNAKQTLGKLAYSAIKFKASGGLDALRTRNKELEVENETLRSALREIGRGSAGLEHSDELLKNCKRYTTFDGRVVYESEPRTRYIPTHGSLLDL